MTHPTKAHQAAAMATNSRIKRDSIRDFYIKIIGGQLTRDAPIRITFTQRIDNAIDPSTLENRHSSRQPVAN
jgi:hypothetical protein